MSAFGARQGDTAMQDAWSMPYVSSLGALNDVAYKVWRGNYGVFLTQIDPNTTSQGYWRVGSKAEPYGRFARGFNNSQDKNQLFFDVEDKMFSTGYNGGKEVVQIRLVYYDNGTGTFALNYDATGNANKQAYEVTKTNSGTWKEKIITVSDAHFDNRGPRDSDISLVNTDSEDDIFHMVEVIFGKRPTETERTPYEGNTSAIPGGTQNPVKKNNPLRNNPLSILQ
jgi:hypothetical protein